MPVHKCGLLLIAGIVIAGCGGWGRNEIPVDASQTRDFLSYQGIFAHD
ncbi:MAG TPA: hypothetical protein VGR80_14305 [Steroidobacteraceae bacterium]|nr:hypothetical protein [Gammaproteobacteria bacterium]HEV2287214.1 hypothetical protein [Steroidobacteraceae bacterium]